MSFESKWVMMFDTKVCSISLEAIRVNEIGLYCWVIFVRLGSISRCSSFRSLGNKSSGPEALLGL